VSVAVIIPALDEEESIATVVNSARAATCTPLVVVVDNGSKDATAARAAEAGATVVREARRGYGAACLRGIKALPNACSVVVFLDGDGSDDIAAMPRLVNPVLRGTADFVIGSRTLGQCQPGAMTPQQHVGNLVASFWLRRRFALPATDLGPFRAIRRDALASLDMHDTGYGWTVEMQIKAAHSRLRYLEVPVDYKKRTGRSKVSGTLRGAVGAGIKILGLLAWHDVLKSRMPHRSR